MAGYAVIGRIGRVDPHLAGRSPVAPAGWGAAEAAGAAQGDALVGETLDVVMEERWAHVREIWAQTTFFLFDANSWR